MKLAFLFITLITAQTFASGSFGVRGGGNTCVEHFISYGKVIHSLVDGIMFDSDRFLEKVNTAEIVEVQSEMVNYEGNQYIAMNEPAANRIYLSQKWCRESRLGLAENKSALIAFHEILGLSEPGLDKNYELSSTLYTATGLTEEDFYYLALTGGRDRHIFKTETYTWARPNATYPERVNLQIKADDMSQVATVDCGTGNNPTIPSFLIILGKSSKYSFVNRNMCENLLEFLKFRTYSKFKVTFLVGTTTHTIYDVINE